MKIVGMSCEHCVKRISDALSSIEGVISVEVNLRKKTAKIELSSSVSDDTLTEAVRDAGYSVRKIK